VAEIELQPGHLPRMPVQYEDFYDGDDWMEAMHKRGWVTPGIWGELGWPLGTWPLMIVAIRVEPEHNLWAIATYIEGDVEVHAYDDRKELLHAVTAVAVDWWRKGFVEDGPDDLPEQGWLPHHGKLP
jgi:hypothetical protein